MRILQEPAYILHTRPFRDTSLLLDVMTQHHGRISVLAKGIRKQHSKTAGLLQAFIPLSLSYTGKASLKSLIQVENNGVPLCFSGFHLYSALYINELLYKVLPQDDPDEPLYYLYETSLQNLLKMELEAALRLFEFRLLNHLGFGQSYQQDESGQALQQEAYYHLQPEKGWGRVGAIHHPDLYLGEHLLAIGKEDFSGETLKIAKKIARTLIQNVISKPIMARKLFLRDQHAK